MKRSKILLEADKIIPKEMPKKTRAGKILRYLLFSAVISSAVILSSCSVEYESPYHEHDRYGVIIDPWDYHWRHEHHEWIEEHPQWRREYPRHEDEDR